MLYLECYTPSEIEIWTSVRLRPFTSFICSAIIQRVDWHRSIVHVNECTVEWVWYYKSTIVRLIFFGTRFSFKVNIFESFFLKEVYFSQIVDTELRIKVTISIYTIWKILTYFIFKFYIFIIDIILVKEFFK